MERLPPELFEEIADHLSRDTLRIVKLVHRRFWHPANKALFRTVKIWIQQDCLEMFVNIAVTGSLQRCVQHLMIGPEIVPRDILDRKYYLNWLYYQESEQHPTETLTFENIGHNLGRGWSGTAVREAFRNYNSFIRQQEIFSRSGLDLSMLAFALRHLPNLRRVSVSEDIVKSSRFRPGQQHLQRQILLNFASQAFNQITWSGQNGVYQLKILSKALEQARVSTIEHLSFSNASMMHNPAFTIPSAVAIIVYRNAFRNVRTFSFDLPRDGSLEPAYTRFNRIISTMPMLEQLTVRGRWYYSPHNIQSLREIRLTYLHSLTFYHLHVEAECLLHILSTHISTLKILSLDGVHIEFHSTEQFFRRMRDVVDLDDVILNLCIDIIGSEGSQWDQVINKKITTLLIPNDLGLAVTRYILKKDDDYPTREDPLDDLREEEPDYPASVTSSTFDQEPPLSGYEGYRGMEEFVSMLI